MPIWFEFYEGDSYHECKITKSGYFMHRWGICSQHVMMPWSRISSSDYVSYYERFLGA